MKGESPSCNNTESPKTPGGISKSLLTPCRRVGLSRKWRKGSCSPFISPLSTQNSNTPDSKQEKECKKRKICIDTVVVENTTPKIEQLEKNDICTTPQSNANDITTTPSRNRQIPRKKSKTLCLSRKNSKEIQKDDPIVQRCKVADKPATDSVTDASSQKKDDKVEINNPEIVKLSRSNSISRSLLSLKKTVSVSETKIEESVHPKENAKCSNKERSPNNLTKECMVVIQKEILKNNPLETTPEADPESDVPLCDLKKDKDTVTLNILGDDDFICTETLPKIKLKKLSLKKNTPKNSSWKIETEKSSQSSQDDDELISKRTILIRKSYDKIDKPFKAKSTGSITQKDVDDLKARIEMKKKLLMAEAMSVETEELRSLIKKWQKGCQEALMQLLELMKKKLPDRPNMDHAEILKLLNIPKELVGYDSDNECFLTPDDNNILLNSFKL